MASKDNSRMTSSAPGTGMISLVIICALLIFGGSVRAQDPPDFRVWQSAASRLVDQGDRQLSKGDLTMAISSFDKAISLESRNADAYMGRALAEQMAGKLDEAAGDYTRALQIHPRFAPLHSNYGSFLLQRGDINGAAVEFSTAIKLDKHSPEAHAALGMISFTQGNCGEALAHLDRAIKLFPPFLEDAVKVVAKNPHLAAAYDLRGQVRQSSDDLKGALEDFDRAIEIDSEARYFNNRGQARSRNGDDAGANSDYAAALQLDPNMAAVYFNRGQARLRHGDMDGAVSDFTAMLVRSDNLTNSADILPANISLQSIMYTSYLSRGLAWEGKADFTHAEKDYSQAIKLNPDSGIALACRGRVFLETGRLDDAIRELDLAITKDPTWAMAFLDRGIARMMQGNQAAAEDDFTKCLALNSSLKTLLDRRVQLVQNSLKRSPGQSGRNQN